ncbi:alpha-(1,3)-fucosyltransferase 7 isoform X1 [Hypanus sabinus]|uniref:alpha-(1,3)-fucosyltransferase 7 isoform X1 n=1 Tax=Hypanus sabinus TaxID=79690 RepID=UPI0028C4C353|nr:alpha-(1,3)-fucosyltransferase 7 isoform X1 [Hypanus sabinus]XP_059799779.1 alpha-(1,3)-fucosyltransferase 7 isoform X1 [Hypanus sabinus]XP_059799780.1 alpha-(1,3)-fucosyltransferase 7 isoform X1 [Hypanus sabinus]
MAFPFRLIQKCRLFVVLVLMAAIVMLFQNNSRPIIKPATSPSDDPVVVLVWNWPFLVNSITEANVCRDLYAVENCILTCDKSMFDRANVVAFHHRELQNNISNLPREKRPHNQKWLWVSLESPSNTKGIHHLNGLFNWTMTYKRDSDIFIPYGHLMKRSQHSDVSIPKKPFLATWVISNYHRKSWRAEVHLNLSKYMQIDIYGKSVKKYLPKTLLLPTISKYAFYLAFENSIHKDYITEKLWRNSFMAGSVPVVLGPPRVNYEKFIPSDSFIHVNDFPSVEELASFLKNLWQNRTGYEKYFNWRRHYTVKMLTNWTERFCTICSKFNSLPQSKIYDNLHGWFHK